MYNYYYIYVYTDEAMLRKSTQGDNSPCNNAL